MCHLKEKRGVVVVTGSSSRSSSSSSRSKSSSILHVYKLLLCNVNYRNKVCPTYNFVIYFFARAHVICCCNISSSNCGSSCCSCSCSCCIL